MFGLLGPVECLSAGEPVDLGTTKQRAVLAALLVDAGRLVPWPALIERVWGETATEVTRQVVYTYINRIRRVLAAVNDAGAGPVTLIRRSGGYLLDVDPELIDLHRFLRLIKAASPDHRDPHDRAHPLRQALDLWRGPALADIPGDWAANVRQAFSIRRLDAAVNWAHEELRLGREATLVAPLRELTTEYPLAEPLAAALMRTLGAVGRRAEALDHFATVRAHLAEELGVEPGTELRAVHEEILRGGPGGSAPPSRALPASRPPAQLPASVTVFTGRAAELSTLDSLVTTATEHGSAGVAVVSGTAGVGKTTLAIRWAHRVLDRFPDGQLYLDLRGYDPDRPLPVNDALGSLLRGLGTHGTAVPVEPAERAALYRTLAAGRRMLVVLDNASGSEQVRHLLPGTPSCFTLITSRDDLAEVVVRHGAHRLHLDLLPERDAVALLATLVGPRVTEHPATATAAVGCCARLPLALRIAAEHLAGRPTLSLRALTDGLADEQRRLDLLGAGGGHRTAVRSVFSWSYRVLPPTAARSFALLGAHPGPDIDRYAAAALLDTDARGADQLLDPLVRAHLLEVAGPERYGMHDLLRAYARELAAETGDRTAAVRRWLDHCLANAAVVMDVFAPQERHRRPRPAPPEVPVPVPADVPGARAWLDANRSELTTAAMCAVAAGKPGVVGALTATLFRYLETGGYYADAARMLHETLRVATAAGDSVGEAGARRRLAVIHARRGRFREAVNEASRALAIFEELDDRPAIAEALNSLGTFTWQLRRYPTAAARLHRAIDLFQAIDEQSGAAVAMGNLAGLYEDWQRYDDAIPVARRALEIFSRTADHGGVARTLAILGSIHERVGRLDDALDHYRRSLTAAQNGGVRNIEGRTLGRIARVHQRAGRHDTALTLGRRALAATRDVGDRVGELEVRNVMGAAYQAHGRHDEAADEYRNALDLATTAGDQRHEAEALNGLAEVYRSTGRLAQARTYQEAATAITDEIAANC